MRSPRIAVPAAWEDLAREVARAPGAVLLLGGPDTGKSTLARFLALRCYETGLRTALVDSDLGQSMLGLPATVSSTPIVSTESLDAPSLLFRFVGAVSPQGHMHRFLQSLRAVMNRVREMNPQVILIDTTGFIQGVEARQLKHRKIDLIGPAHIVALQRGDEAEHLLTVPSGIGQVLIHRPSISNEVQRRTPQERRRSREERFRRYFREAKLLKVDTRSVAFRGTWFRSGERIPDQKLGAISKILKATALYGETSAEESWLVLDGDRSELPVSQLGAFLRTRRVRTVDVHCFAHYLVGLCDKLGESLALGIVKELIVQEDKLLVHTPLVSPASISTVEFGFLRLGLSGQEVGPR